MIKTPATIAPSTGGPTVGETEPQRFGRILARDRFEPLKAKEKMLVQDMQAKEEATNQAIPNLMQAAMGSSHEDALKFQKGLLRGMTLEPDELSAVRVWGRHTRTFYVLALLWPQFAKCRSLGEIHRILCKGIGEKNVGSLKTFENRVAKRIGLKVRGRGRPRSK